jgi:uncharacterized protein YndB with AHSA1/START domain
MKLCDLAVARTIHATAEEIFDVWMDPSSPGGPWFGSKRVIISPVVDGLFYHAVEHEGRTWPHYGRFVQINRPHRIEVTLRHTGLPDDELGRQHEQGWTWMLSALAQRFESRSATTQPA